ncbi:MAG: energy transducer TonB [Sandaracinaceae bacterium]|nr:energy transducer TonB [Sandaracinaceae bacterium]
MTQHIEVVASWDGNPLESTLLAQAQPLRIGPTAGCWFELPEEVLAGEHELLVPQNGGWLLVAPEGAEVRIAKDGVVVESTERNITLPAGSSAEVRIGSFAFFVRPTAAVVETTPRGSRRYGWMRWLAVAAVLHALVLGLFALTPPNVSALNAGDRADMTRYIPVSVDAFAHQDDPATPTPSGDPGGAPSQAGNERGGEDDRVAESGTPAPSRPGRRQNQPAPRFVSASNINDLGAIAAVRAMNASWGDDTSPYDAGNATEGEGGLANAARLSMPRGPSWGPGDMSSTGVGTCDPSVRDCTAGIISTGDLRTSGDHPDPGWNPHPPRTHRLPPQPGPTRTMGALSRDQVRRTVRQHINEVRFCYEQGLVSRPDLEGRVAVSFIVTPAGVVQSSTVASDSTGNDQVAGCVSSAVRRWTFPSAEGLTGVTYPFVFQSN